MPGPCQERNHREKRKRQQIQSKGCLDDKDLTSDISNYIGDDVKEDNKEFINPDIDKVGGWVYGEEDFFPDIDGILNMWWTGRWKKGRKKTLPYEQVKETRKKDVSWIKNNSIFWCIDGF